VLNLVVRKVTARLQKVKMDIQKVGWDMDWIQLAQDRDRWRALVNVVMNLGVA
jgi:hypothetical protein